MKNNLNLGGKDLKSIKKFKQQVLKEFLETKFILYGSKVKGIDDEFSDIDILVLLNKKITTKIEERIFDIGYEVGLEYGVVFGIVVESERFWMSPLSKAMPFHWNINREGVLV